jgi:hypothetical protein
MDVELEISLTFLEGALGAWFRYTTDCFMPEFTITGDLDAWSWRDLSKSQIMNFLATILTRALGRANTRFQTPLELVELRFGRDQPTAGRLTESKLSDALYGMFTLMAVVEVSSSTRMLLRSRVVNATVAAAAALRHTLFSHLEKKEHTLTLLNVVRRLKTSAILRCYEQYATAVYYDLGDDYSIISKGVENLIEGLNHVRAISQHNSTNPVEPDYAIRLLCFGTYLVELPNAGRYINQWRAMFKILVDLTYESLLVAAPPPSAFAYSRQEFSLDAVVYCTAKLMQSPNGSLTGYSDVAAQCLAYIEDLDPIHQDFDEITKDKCPEASKRTAENHMYPDTLVEMLAAMYFVSGRTDADETKWWRVKKLGVKQRVCAALASANVVGEAHFNVIPPVGTNIAPIPSQLSITP